MEFLHENSAASCHYLLLSVLYILQGTPCKLRRLASDFVKKESVTKYEKAMLITALIALVIDALTFLLK